MTFCTMLSFFYQAEEEGEEVTDSFVPLTNEMERMVSHNEIVKYLD